MLLRWKPTEPRMDARKKGQWSAAPRCSTQLLVASWAWMSPWNSSALQARRVCSSHRRAARASHPCDDDGQPHPIRVPFCTSSASSGRSHH
uniref:Uncharacterized protein n=1 Tax=Arundo donax TaxID=35708 RepID=A0A0A9B177_ARUDO